MAKKEKNAFLSAVMEIPETMAAIARDMWGWIAGLWSHYVAAHSILWWLILYAGVILALLFWPGSDHAFLHWAYWIEPKGTQTNGTEGIRNLVWSLATLVGGAAAGIGLILAARRTSAANDQAEAALQQSEAALKQNETAFQSLVTERFTKAVEQLGYEKRAVRLGAIYALERIAKDSSRDRDTIVETLAAYIREMAPWPPRNEKGHPFNENDIEIEEIVLEENPLFLLRPPIDIAAALTVICRLLPNEDPMRRIVDLRHTDLRGLDAPGIDLSRMRLDHVNLSKATLSSANLTQTNMSGTNLSSTRMQMVKLHGATLDWADLSDAIFLWGRLHGASLKKVNLSSTLLLDSELDNASLSGANLSGAQLHASYFSNVDLSEAQNLTQAQIDSIQYRRDNPPKNLPAGLTLPKPIGRIDDV